jgi:hypothetical protein
MTSTTDLTQLLPSPPFRATINGQPAKMEVNKDGIITITATIPNYSIEWKR